MIFNDSFMWGTGTSSAQIEGAIDIDGKSLSIWDVFSQNKKNIADGYSTDFACDSYHRYKEDIKLLKQLDCKYYRFSLSWPRILPQGIGAVNQKGLEYYINFIDELKAAGIEPFVTLYHWDLPYCLEEKGGFLNKEFPLWFEYYTDIVTKAFGDRVKYYITINEPQCIVQLGYCDGAHAPGKKYDIKEQLSIIHNLLLAHGRSVRIIRNNIKEAKISFAPCCTPIIPVRENEELNKLCENELFSVKKDRFAFGTSIYMDPVFKGDYPEKYYKLFDKDDYPDIKKEDLLLINQDLDFVCQNIYTATYGDIIDGELKQIPYYRGYPESNIEWGKVCPETLYYTPIYLYNRYHKPIIITENGMCCHDNISTDNKIHDENRIDFIKKYLTQLNSASEKVPVAGYFYWSLMDNFEWALGYTKRFGLVYVDFRNGERIEKDSYYYYKSIIENKHL